MNENEAIVATENNGLIGELNHATTSYVCSLPNETTEDKAKLFNIMNNPDYKIRDKINTVIEITDMYCELVNVANKETGEVNTAPRIVLIDKDGKSYQSVSMGIFNAVKKLIGIFGQPHWDTPIPVRVLQKSLGTNQILTLEIAV